MKYEIYANWYRKENYIRMKFPELFIKNLREEGQEVKLVLCYKNTQNSQCNEASRVIKDDSI